VVCSRNVCGPRTGKAIKVALTAGTQGTGGREARRGAGGSCFLKVSPGQTEAPSELQDAASLACSNQIRVHCSGMVGHAWLPVRTCRVETRWAEAVKRPSVTRVRPSDRRLSAKLVPTFADRGFRVVCATDPYGRILGFCLPSCSSVVLTRLSGPRSRPTTSQKIW
jgi:hypothetical protein